MKVAVTTPTGNVGSALTQLLLDRGAQVVLLARQPDKVTHFVDRGAHVRAGSQDDSAFVTDAISGADALFWLTPPDNRAPDLRARLNQFGRVVAAAVRASGVPRVVNVSSVGAHLGRGCGLVDGLADIERTLNDAARNVTHLRPGFFFENFLWQLDSIASEGRFRFPMHGSSQVSMIAARDVARAAADRLLNPVWSGQSALELLGPEDLSFDEAVTRIGEGLGRPIVHEQVPEDAVRQALLLSGAAGASFVDLLLEMYRAIDQRLMRPARPRRAENTTPTTLTTFAREVMAPLLAAKASAGGT